MLCAIGIEISAVALQVLFPLTHRFRTQPDVSSEVLRTQEDELAKFDFVS